jgi:RNA polymerase sigma factor (sigma-70 family)
MGDRDIVAAIIAGDPAGLAAAYDRYAASLHAYCATLLGEPADAADAVQDAFVIAAVKLSGLRDADRLRPWLYAVARNECHRRLRARARQAGLDEAAEAADEYVDISQLAERAELRSLVRAALGGLNPGDREVIELNLRHDLVGADLAEALGVPPNQGYALASRARGQLERSLGALLVARAGRSDCADLSALLAGWDGELTPLLRKRVSRHIEDCAVCGERKRRALSPAMLLTVLPLIPVPAGLRHQILRLVSDDSPEAAGYRAHVAARAGPFGASGFPVQLAPVAVVRGRGRGRPGRHSGPGAAARPASGRAVPGRAVPGRSVPGRAVPGRSVPGRSVVASVGVAAGLFLLGGASVAYLMVSGAARSLDVTSPHVGPVPSSAVATGAAPASSAPGAASPQPAGVQHGPQSGPAAAAAASSQPAAAPDSPPPGSGSATASAPASPPADSSSPPASSPVVPPPVLGVLSETPVTVVLAAGPAGDAAGPATARSGTAQRRQAAVVTWSGTFALTAAGAPVSFSILAPAGLTIQPDSGTVIPGTPVTITVSVGASASVPFLSTLSVGPGGLTVLVEYPPAGTASASPPASAPASSSPPPSDPAVSSPPPAAS